MIDEGASVPASFALRSSDLIRFVLDMMNQCENDNVYIVTGWLLLSCVVSFDTLVMAVSSVRYLASLVGRFLLFVMVCLLVVVTLC